MVVPAKRLARAIALFGGIGACSGTYAGLPADGGVDGTSSAPPASTPGAPPSPASSSAAPSATAPPSGARDASADASDASEASTDGCLEPEPNGSAVAPATLPPRFTCGRIDVGGDIDHYTYTTVVGDKSLRITASPVGRADALTVIVRQAGSTVTLGAGDTLSQLTPGSTMLIEAKATDDLALSYGIVIDR